jgi:hypothetical protein
MLVEFIISKVKVLSSKITPINKPKINWATLSTSQEDFLVLQENKYNIDWAEFVKNPNSIELYLKLIHNKP